MEIKSIADIYRAAELQVIFYSDKTNPRGNQAVGQGKARSFFAIKDLKNTDCMVRDMARLWLVSERVSSYRVFSWAADTQGVTRKLVSDMLKEAAIATGIKSRSCNRAKQLESPDEIANRKPRRTVNYRTTTSSVFQQQRRLLIPKRPGAKPPTQ